MQVDMDATNGDVWDDSALLDSWNTALEEYKKYHSIHARGGALENTLLQTVESPFGEDIAVIDGSHGPKVAGTSSAGAPSKALDAESDDAAEQVAAAVALGPQVILGSGQDEGFKNLLMAWYYAGYYTGLHQGTQQGKQEARQEK